MLMQVKFLNYQKLYSFAPAREDAVIQTDDITSVRASDGHRGSGPFVLVRFKNGDDMICTGTPNDFLRNEVVCPHCGKRVS